MEREANRVDEESKKGTPEGMPEPEKGAGELGSSESGTSQQAQPGVEEEKGTEQRPNE
jgi:hypothetical protein